VPIFKLNDPFVGLDRLHNPEFTTCEFYSTYTSIQTLLAITENMLSTIVKNLEGVPKDKDVLKRLPRTNMPPLALKSGFFKGPYRQIDFLPALNEALGLTLPDLRAESATGKVVSILQEKNIALPAHPSLPRLLDKLSATYLEPQCEEPTWIINHPECLSPLSKSFFHPSRDVAQPVAARAELFIHGREIVNCYEEENSPFEQRRKFMMQQRYANVDDSSKLDEEAMKVDEDYLKALEWGLPPTGGWGCGIDRLVMLLTGKQRINEVLTFGNLRSVTRTPDSRQMVQVPALSTHPSKSTSNHDAASGATEKEMERSDEKVPGGAGASKNRPQLDAPEEAVLKIKQKMKWENSSRSKPLESARGSSSAEQKRLAVWLAGRGGPDPAEWLQNK
jgi:lysyl-tRNA synthetase class II